MLDCGHGRRGGQKEDLVKGLHSGALDEVRVALWDTPIDLSVQLAGLRHAKIVHLAVKGVKQRVQPSCDVPATLHKHMTTMSHWYQ